MARAGGVRRTRRRRYAFAGLVVLSSTLMFADAREQSAGRQGIFAAARSSVGEVAGPLQESVAGVPRAVGSLGDAFGALSGDPADRTAQLEADNAALSSQVRTSEYDRRRADELDGLLRIAGLGQYRVVPAKVIAIGAADGFSRAVTIDAGSLDGIVANQTVLNGHGLVGRVKSVSSTTSTVVLAIDASSTVGVRLESLQAGYAQGSGGPYDSPLTVDLFSPTAPVAAGDRLVTFGSREGAPFVAGVPVGEVTEVQGLTGSLTKRVLVKPFVDFGALDLVGVVVEPPRTDPRTSVLPPKPGETPTVAPPRKLPASGPDDAEPEILGPPVVSPSPRARTPSRAVAEGRD